MEFILSKEIKIQLFKEQWQNLCSKEKTKTILENNKAIAFDILHDGIIIGFAMLRKNNDGTYFLWSYAIDKNFQGRGLGKLALIEILDFLKRKYNVSTVLTTYKLGNNIAKNLYEKIGFIQTDIIDEPDCKEVNMIKML